MAAINPADVSINEAGDIRWVGGAGTHTGLEFHQFLSGLADDENAVGNDLISIVSFTPSDRATDTIITLVDHTASSGPRYNIDAAFAEHLYDCSITQGSGANQERWSGLQIIGSFTATPVVVQNNTIVTSFWSTSWNPNATLGIAVQILVKSIDSGAAIDGGRVRVQTRNYGDQYREASTVLGLGNSPAAPGNINNDTFNNTAIGTIAALPLDFVTHAAGGYNLIDLVNGNGAQPYSSQWDLVTAGVSKSEFYEWHKWAQRDGSTEQLFGMDGQLFRGITHEVALTTPRTGTFAAYEAVSWTGGTGQMLAIDSTTAGTKMWIQLLTGVAPTDTQTITGASTATATASGTATQRPLGVESAIGNYVGSLLGAYGVGVKPNALTNTDQLIDLNAVNQQPPNNVTFNFNGLEIGEDYALIGPAVGGLLDYDQLIGATGQNASGAATYVATAAIPSDTPISGTIRVYNGFSYDRVPYTSFTGSTFTLTGTLPSAGANLRFAWDTEGGTPPWQIGETLTFGGGGTAELLSFTDEGTSGVMAVRMLTGTNPVDNESITGGTSGTTGLVDGATLLEQVGGFISYLDKLAAADPESFTYIFSAPRSHFVRGRDGGVTPIKTFETAATMGAGGGSATMIRTSDA